ncbi:fungal-specific transcription factor domain-containing protein [Penicillium nucicola]|uniref:fungal-specific transcription factor domain-containing protein n=1 Tax=Penicillium nucicola TaxID=1850975 RepID=UPI002545422D|nr:fungal-specific transcription factor domain-containing protein [Penicillium nucicola]KAJ5766320.1 fungal-specific transcription factor domain-containing protein [Penicillium nucicola]
MQLNSLSYERSDTDQSSLDSIERELTAIKQDTTHLSGKNNTEEIKRANNMAKLYQLAGLIYFERVLKRSPNNKQVKEWATEAFGLLRESVICERAFPLFFIACEAQNDIQRELILSVFENTHKRSHQRRLYAVQGMIESMWVQNDLIMDSNTQWRTYVDTLNTIMSSNELLPTLA